MNSIYFHGMNPTFQLEALLRENLVIHSVRESQTSETDSICYLINHMATQVYIKINPIDMICLIDKSPRKGRADYDELGVSAHVGDDP